MLVLLFVFIAYKNFVTKPNFTQTLIALLRLRVLRMFRDLQKLYIMIVLPLAFAALGLYMNSIQELDSKQTSLALNAGNALYFISCPYKDIFFIVLIFFFCLLRNL